MSFYSEHKEGESFDLYQNCSLKAQESNKRDLERFLKIKLVKEISFWTFSERIQKHLSQ